MTDLNINTVKELLERQLESTKDVAELINLVRTTGKTNANRKKRIIEPLGVGETIAQGDLYFTRLNFVPPNSKKMLRPSRILGTSQNHKLGRHTIKKLNTVEVFKLEAWRRTVLHGFVLEIKQETEIQHPEHANLIFLEDKNSDNYTIQVSYQREFAQVVELRRARD